MISLVCTVLNEKETLPDWLKSISNQDQLPDEIVIVDGGSNDGTWEWLQTQKPSVLLRLFQMSGNIASGRNRAIRDAKGDIIVVTDAGCAYEREWLQKITKPILAGESKFVTTAFGPLFKNDDSLLIYSIASATTPAKREFAKNWLPSSRSVAFTKEIWHTAGGYPEWIPYCEDVIFDKLVLKNGVKFAYIREPLVFWRPRQTLKTYFKQLYNYTRSEGHGKLNTRRQFIRYLVYLFALVLLARGIAVDYYLLGALWIGIVVYMQKFYLRFGEFSTEKNFGFKLAAIFIVPLVVVIGDIAKMCGWPVGVFERHAGKIKIR